MRTRLIELSERVVSEGNMSRLAELLGTDEPAALAAIAYAYFPEMAPADDSLKQEFTEEFSKLTEDTDSATGTLEQNIDFF